MHRPAPSLIALAVVLTAAATSAQSRILWTTAPINGPTDVRTDGKLCVAANLGPETNATVVNGVHFQQDRSFWTQKLPNVGATATTSIQYFPPIAASSGGYDLIAPYNRTAGGIGPKFPTDPDYNTLLNDGRHRSGSVGATAVEIKCSIDGLTPGNQYMVQIWCGNRSRSTRHHEWDNGQGGRGAAAGGIYLRSDGATFGEVATGFFTADPSGSQQFINYHQAADPNATPPILETWGACSAIQVRDVTQPSPRPASVNYYGMGTPGTQAGGRNRVGGSNWAPQMALTGHPTPGANVNLTLENSSGQTNNAIVALGLSQVSFPFLGGELLANATFVLPVVIPFDNTPNRAYTTDHELSLPVTLPNAPITLYVQSLQIDPGAVGGVSFSAGMRIEVGR